MNMISTGAFQTEMDASSRQPTLAEKFAAVWEKKNAKAARAGGVSLMALSLAACGSSDDDTATTTDTTTDTTTTTAVTTVVPTAVSKTFTANLDTLEGGAGDDSFNGVYYADGGTGTTAFPGDSVAGGDGSDTLNISVAGLSTAAQSINAIRTTGVETLLVTNFDTNANDLHDTTVDTSLMSGLTTVGLNASSGTGDTAFTNMTSIIDASMGNGAADLTMTYVASAVAGATDTQALAVSNVSAGSFTANGAETIAITTSTVKSTLTDVSSDAMTKLTIAGDQALTVSNALATTTIDASASTGAVNITLGANAAHVVTGGSGADTINAGTTLASGDTISGGAGSDLLKLSVGNATINQGTAAAKGELYNVSGFETIDMASTHDSAALNLTSTSGITGVDAAANVRTYVLDTNAGDTAKATNSTAIGFTLNGTAYTTAAQDGSATSGEAAVLLKTAIDAIAGFSAAVTGGSIAITNSGASSDAVELVLTANHTAEDSSAYNSLAVSNITDQKIDVYSGTALTASLADASGTADSLSINLATRAADKGFAKDIGTITANNIETINMDATGMSNGMATTVASLTGNSIGTLNVTGDSDVTFTAFTSSTKLANIDASTSSGDISLAAAPVAATLPSSIKTGGGNDTIAMGATLTAADVIDAGGNNIPLNGTLTGSDTVSATGNIGTITASSGLQIANAESITLTIGAAAASYIDMANVTGTTTFAVANDTNGGTVQMTNLGAHHTVGVGVGATEYGASATATLDLALADATGTADSISLNYSDTVNAASLQTLKIANTVETLNISAPKIAQNVTLTNTNMAATNVVITDGIAGGLVAMGTLNVATTNVDASAYLGELNVTTAATGAVTVSAHGAATLAHAITTGAGNDTVTLAGLTAATASTINGGAGTGDTLSLSITSAATDFTNVSNIETINLTVGGNTQAGFDDVSKDDGINAATVVNILGGDSLSTFTIDSGGIIDDATTTLDASTFGGTIAIDVASNAFDASLNLKGGASATDTVSIISAADDNKVASMSGVETLTITTVDGDATSTVDLTNVTGLTTIDVKFVTNAASEKMIVTGIAAGTKVKTTMAETGDNLVLTLADASGAADALTVELTDGGVVLDVLNFDAAGIESVAFTTKDTTHSTTLDIAGLTATGTGTTSTTFAGAGALVLNGVNATTDTLDATAATGTVTLAAAQRSGDAKTIKGGQGNDSLAMENAGDVMGGGLGSGDTLVIDYTAVMGGIAIDLSAVDQISTFDGAANAASQTGFENVDLSAYDSFGSQIIAAAGGSTMTGTVNADQISGGAGADTITGGTGVDIISLGAADGATDTVVINGAHIGTAAASAAADIVSEFEAGASKDQIQISVSGIEALDTVGTLFDLRGTTTIAAATTVDVDLGGTGTYDLDNSATTENILVMQGAGITATAFEANVDTGSTNAIKTANLDDNDAILVLSDDGISSALFVVANTKGSDLADAFLGDTDASVIHLVTFEGVSASELLVDTNFDFIA
jgi:hypothetical protein